MAKATPRWRFLLVVTGVCSACSACGFWLRGPTAFAAPAAADSISRSLVRVGRGSLIQEDSATELAIAPHITPLQEGRSAGRLAFFCATAVALVASMHRKTSRVVMRYKPIKEGRDIDNICRRLEPYGAIPSALNREVGPPKILKERQGPPKRLSVWGRHFVERMRVEYHYNIKYRQLRNYMMRGFQRGIDYPMDHCLQELESRMDNLVWRVGIAPTMWEAQQFVSSGHLEYKLPSMTQWRTLNCEAAHAQIGMEFRVKRGQHKNEHSMDLARKHQAAVGFREIPKHIKWDAKEMHGTYLDVCSIMQLGIQVDEDYFMRFWTENQNELRRLHFRYYAGTNIVIKKMKIKDHQHIRATPENVINMRRGLGLYARGRRRPPCLWGRSKPANSIYGFRRPHQIPYF